MAADFLGGGLRVRRTRGLQFAFALTAAVVLLRSSPLGPRLSIFSLIENYAYDAYFDYRPARDASDFVILGIDEESLLPRHLGRFPWPRSVYAQVLPKLSEAKVVGIDLLLSEPSADDAALAAAIRRHGRVVLAAHSRDRQGEPPPFRWGGYGPCSGGGVPTLNPRREFVPPTPLLAAAAAGLGYVDIYPDHDGIYRSAIPLEAANDGRLYPHFATELARLAVGLPTERLLESCAARRFSVGGPPVPLRAGRMLIDYAGRRGTVTVIPFWKVLDPKWSPEALRGKIVLIGPTAAGLSDIRPAPFRSEGRVFYGVETNANIARTLLSEDHLREASGPLPWGLYALLVGLLTGWAVWSTREVLAAVLGVGIVALFALPSFMVGVVLLHQVVPYGGIVLAAALPLAWALYERLGAEKRQVAQQFGTYVSPGVLRELADHPEVVRRGSRRTVTLLFSDVRGSTTLAEHVEPDVWIAQLNEYLSEMSDAIFAYDGYLDKFMGDGIMAVWNTFGDQPDHAEQAAKAAVQMLERLKRLNARWEGEPDRQPFQIGIGLHTGEVVIGNVGSDRRAQYTAIGDAVNTASRVEALTKDFRAHLLLSETTAAVLADRLPLIELGEAELKGREKPLRVYTPRGYPGEVLGHVRQEEK